MTKETIDYKIIEFKFEKLCGKWIILGYIEGVLKYQETGFRTKKLAINHINNSTFRKIMNDYYTENVAIVN